MASAIAFTVKSVSMPALSSNNSVGPVHLVDITGLPNANASATTSENPSLSDDNIKTSESLINGIGFFLKPRNSIIPGVVTLFSRSGFSEPSPNIHAWTLCPWLRTSKIASMNLSNRFCSVSLPHPLIRNPSGRVIPVTSVALRLISSGSIRLYIVFTPDKLGNSLFNAS